jgi:adenosylcobinamide amidohydrolase
VNEPDPSCGPARLVERTEGDRRWPALIWAPDRTWRMISTGVDGGGLGERSWWLNTQVSREYFEPDPVAHLRRIAAGLGLDGAGVGMLTAADVRYVSSAEDQGVDAVATVGLGLPVPAAAPPDRIVAETPGEQPVADRTTADRGTAPGPGTINVLVVVPVPLSDAALVNAVITATEAKTQALLEAGVPGTGTSSDAVCIACPTRPPGEAGVAPYGGPRSEWGARIARAVHAAVGAGTRGWLTRHPPGDQHRRWPEAAAAAVTGDGRPSGNGQPARPS